MVGGGGFGVELVECLVSAVKSCSSAKPEGLNGSKRYREFWAWRLSKRVISASWRGGSGGGAETRAYVGADKLDRGKLSL